MGVPAYSETYRVVFNGPMKCRKTILAQSFSEAYKLATEYLGILNRIRPKDGYELISIKKESTVLVGFEKDTEEQDYYPEDKIPFTGILSNFPTTANDQFNCFNCDDSTIAKGYEGEETRV